MIELASEAVTLHWAMALVSDLNLKNIDWAIVGGESGPGARPMQQAWVEDIRDQCTEAEVAFFFKQWGGTNKKRTGRELEGRTWDDMPDRKAIPLLVLS